MKLIARSNPQAARDLDYTHRSLREQLSRLGIRQLELDCYADPDGGRFARPLGPIKRARPAWRFRRPMTPKENF